MIKVRKSSDRGQTKLAWLDSKHSFSFGEYYDPNHSSFHTLRVINEDVVSPGAGFDMHPHRDMETITIVLSGSLEHKDSIGSYFIMDNTEVQRMSAGKGVLHSEYNASDKEPLHLYQIWIVPKVKGLVPSYENKKLNDSVNDWVLLASPNGESNALTIHQNVELHQARISKGSKLAMPFNGKQSIWLQVLEGVIKISENLLQSGDGLAVENEEVDSVEAFKDSRVLLFTFSMKD